MINHKPNGDIFLGPIRVYNGFRRAPVRWVFGLSALMTVLALYAIAVIFFGGFGRGY